MYSIFYFLQATIEAADTLSRFIGVTGLLILILTFAFIFFLIYNRQQRNKITLQQRKIQAAFHQVLLQTKLEIQEETFKKVSMELHDNVGQMLSLVKLNLNTLPTGNSDKLDEKLENAKDMLTKIIQEVRDIARTMNSEVVNRLGIAHAIENELQNISKLSSFQVGFNWTEEIVNINPQVELILFRMVQETLHNVIKHSQAGKVDVTGTFVNNNFQLVISDNGVGFTPAKIDYSGSGLINLESRCKLINADLQINSSIGKGTIITISLPVLPIEIITNTTPKNQST